MKLPSVGIALKTALLAWLVTLATLLVFVVVILPWQKRTFLTNLESKAQSVALSLREVAAGAAVNEDYSSVIDHGKEMLAGDESLAYIVFTKNDGFSLIQDRAGWRSENNLAQEWHPAQREPASGIRFMPLFNRRAFHYSQPFDYSGIQWGWIHVGLSLDKYDQSVVALYWITALLGLGCGVLSLGASVAYARRLVRPVLNLQATVQRVAGGDLSAHAETDRDDELGSLAGSVNSMTGALLRRDEILGSVQFAAQRFLGTPNWRLVITEVLARIGGATGASRAYVFENELESGGRLVTHLAHEWAAPGFPSRLVNPAYRRLSFREAGYAHWAEILPRRQIIAARVADLPAEEQTFLSAHGVRSLLIIPIMVEDTWWGFVGLSDCVHERSWSDAERDSLQAMADMLGTAIARQRTQDALLEAKATLEQRVLERTAALQSENRERQQAETALARSLSVINATLESTLDGIMVLGRDGRVKHFNRRFAELWAIKPEELAIPANRHVFTRCARFLKDPKGFIQRTLRLHTDPEAVSVEVVEFLDGRIYEIYTRPQHDDGVSAGRVWSFRDITERKRAEAEITYERDLLQTLLDSLPDTLFFKDLESRFVRVSRSKVEGSLELLRERHRLARPPGEAGPYPDHLQNVETMRQWLQGKTDFDVYSKAAAQLCFDEEQVILRTGRPLKDKIEVFPLPSGANTWNLVTKMPWRDGRGVLLGTYGIATNITAMKEAEANLKVVHQELMQASRLAGMAEVATGVLHNVGNVLNSVNVSATLVRETLQGSEVATLGRVADLMRGRSGDLGRYLTADPKGRLIPGLVIQLADQLNQEHLLLQREHEQLARNVEHIKEIVAMQQDYARVSGVLEKVRVADLLEDALQINTGGLARHGVEVVRQFTEVPPVVVDKHKVMQIIVNLIHNAKYALDGVDRVDRRITLGIGPGGANRVRLTVADNGVGIAPENLTRIFSRGFTTRRNGHGFGLHSGANAAREMGGLLLAESAGPGHGATFTLELPLGGATTDHE